MLDGNYQDSLEKAISDFAFHDYLKDLLRMLDDMTPDNALKSAADLYFLMRVKNSMRPESWQIYLYERAINNYRFDFGIKKYIRIFDDADPVDSVKDAEFACKLMEKRLDEYLSEKNYLDEKIL